MKILWLTLADPYPADNGQFLYSAGLIGALEGCGTVVHACGLRRPSDTMSTQARLGRTIWMTAAHAPRSRWASLRSRWPNLAARTLTTELRNAVLATVEQGGWDAIVFDGVALGWALAPILNWHTRAGSTAALVYIAHNHEENIARIMAGQESRPIRRLIRHFDAAKMGWLERRLARSADLVTSNTPEDQDRFIRGLPDTPVDFVPPGYDGPKALTRRIDATVPRRALIVGSFHWPAKQRSLELFLDAADPVFAAAGIELLVVGNAEDPFLSGLRARVKATRFTGRVEDVFPYMQDARMAVVPDLLGGFKLKTLDYIFSRLPIFAMAGSVPGLPLEAGRGVHLFADHRAQAQGIVEAIDDFDRLNAIQEEAYARCRDQFDWQTIGRKLLVSIDRVRTRPSRKESITQAGAVPSV